MKSFIILSSFLIIHLSCMFSEPSAVLPEGKPGDITFIGDAGSPNVFSVERWQFDEISNLENPEKLIIKATLDISSITCPWNDMLKSVLKKKDYFHFKKFGTATVSINGAKVKTDGTYTCDAELTLKGITQVVPLDFSLSTTTPVRVQAEGVVMRRLFNFSGDGPKDEVPVTISADLVVSDYNQE